MNQTINSAHKRHFSLGDEQDHQEHNWTMLSIQNQNDDDMDDLIGEEGEVKAREPRSLKGTFKKAGLNRRRSMDYTEQHFHIPKVSQGVRN